VIWYGEELGMGDNLALKEREAVRTPMQWDESANGGFSTAKKKDLVRALPGGKYAPKFVNAAAQRDDPESLFEHMERLIAARRACPEVGWGAFEVLNSDRSTLALLHEWQGERLVTLHNFSDKPTKMKLRVENAESFTVMFGDDGMKTTIQVGETIKLGPHAFRWLRVKPGPG
jgi:maltose alpha-D-glucosyltransferase/alpha-amylase